MRDGLILCGFSSHLGNPLLGEGKIFRQFFELDIFAKATQFLKDEAGSLFKLIIVADIFFKAVAFLTDQLEDAKSFESRFLGVLMFLELGV